MELNCARHPRGKRGHNNVFTYASHCEVDMPTRSDVRQHQALSLVIILSLRHDLLRRSAMREFAELTVLLIEVVHGTNIPLDEEL